MSVTLLLFIAIPTYGLLTAETVTSLLNYIGHAKVQLHFGVIMGIYIDKNRNILVERFLASPADRILFIDSDIQFPHDGPGTLWNHNLPVVGGTYKSRLGHQITTKFTRDGRLQDVDPMPDKPFQCTVVPTGFLMVQRETFKSLKRPYFNSHYDQDGEYIGEDVDFCLQCAVEGVPVWCDPTIKLGHVGKYVFT